MRNQQILKKTAEVRQWFEDTTSTILSYDWETTGLSYYHMEPVGLSFCDGERTCYIDIWNSGTEISGIMDLLADHLVRYELIAHNAKFDLKCTRKFLGIEPETIHCTFIAAFLLNENRNSHGLKALAAEDLYVPPGRITKWDQVSAEGYDSPRWYRYCFDDAEWAWDLFQLYRPQLVEQGLWYLYSKIEVPFLHVLADMEINGICVDMAELEALKLRTSNKLIELEDRMMASINKPIFLQHLLFEEGTERSMSVNLRSPQQIIKVLEKCCKLKVPKVKDKETGKYKKSTDVESLTKLQGQHPFVDFLLDYRKVRKLYDSYIVPAFDMIDPDGRIRPSYGIVRTGRTNCSSPNLQQLPNLSKRFPSLNYRSIFVAGPGTKLVGADYSGQELRVLGEISQDSNILNAFKNGFDLHLVTANSVFELKLSDEALTDGTPEHSRAKSTYRDERYKAKNGVNFPIIYGSSEYGISHSLGVPVADAKDWIRKFYELYPGVKLAIEDTREELADASEVRTLMGRKRRFPGYAFLPNWSPGRSPSRARAVRQAFNFKIQGLSADQVKAAAAKGRALGLKFLTIIHDELVIESTDPEQDALVLSHCMKHALSLTVKFEVECKIGDRYSEIK